jgi:predicted transcriptional regulator
LEKAVMDRLWDTTGWEDVRTMHRAVGELRGLARNTIHSTLERLVRKGLVSRRRRGRAYEYLAIVSRSGWISDLLEAVVAGLDSADSAEILVGFVDFAERASASTLEELEELVNDRLRRRDQRGGG